jgi:ribosomal protein S18 acetylase RimI-like enzyme
MTTPHYNFEIATADRLKVTDAEISDLLTQVYVSGGYTSHEEAVSLFAPLAVRARGVLIGARDKQQSKLAGIIIVVPPSSPAKRLAKDNEAELHLLGVRPEYRQHGLGRMLIDTAIDNARRSGCSKLILWTQISMSSAQRLYESAGFNYVNNFEKNGREFKLYERDLCA